MNYLNCVELLLTKQSLMLQHAQKNQQEHVVLVRLKPQCPIFIMYYLWYSYLVTFCPSLLSCHFFQ